MRALAVLPEHREVRLIEQEEPARCGPHDVKIRVLDVAVCGTDREICRFGYGTPPANGRLPLEQHRELLLGQQAGIENVLTFA